MLGLGASPVGVFPVFEVLPVGVFLSGVDPISMELGRLVPGSMVVAGREGLVSGTTREESGRLAKLPEEKRLGLRVVFGVRGSVFDLGPLVFF